MRSLWCFPYANSLESRLSSVLRSDRDVDTQSGAIIALSRASKLGFDAAGAVFLLHCLSSIPTASNHQIMPALISRIEEQYFSSNLLWLDPRSPYSRLLVDAALVDASATTPFRDLVRSLPPKCKALIMGYSPASRNSPPRRYRGPTESEIEARWMNLDPVDMEAVERDHFLKTKQVLRTRHVEARPSPMPAGSRLRQTLGMEFLESIDSLNLDDFVCLLTALLTATHNGVFHRDMKKDAQFAICKRIMQFADEEVGKHILAISLVLSKFEPELEIPNRVWNRKVVPVLRRGVGDVAAVPPQHQYLTEVSRWALLASTVISWGRVKVTGRLMGDLMPKLVDRVHELDLGIASDLLASFVVSGCIDARLVDGISRRGSQMTVSQLSMVVQTRNHFGLFGEDYDRIVDILVSKVESGSSADAMSQAQQLMLLNSVYSSPRQIESEAVLKLTKKVCGRCPDFDIDTLGRIDSVLE